MTCKYRFASEKVFNSGIINSQLSIINYSELQMAATGNENMAAGQHARFIAGEKCDGAGDIFGIKMFF